MRDVELDVLVQHTEITSRRREVIEAIAARMDGNVDDVLTASFLRIGSIQEIMTRSWPHANAGASPAS